MDRLMLLDANGLIYRAYFALYNTPLTTSKGELVNAVFGFWSIVLRGFQDVHPDYVIACFDLSGPTFRHEQFTEYKATRRPMPDDLREQFPKVRELIEAFRIPVYELQGYEADDLIGTLTVQAEARDLQTTIVSGDLDMLQLVTEQTHVMTTRGGVQMTVTYDPARILERYGLRPDQMIDFKALKGDTTDNIPGIPGVGEKTAAKLLQDFDSLDAVYEAPDRVQPEKLRAKLLEFRDQVLASRQLVTIQRDLPVTLDLSNAGLGDYDRAEVMRLFREYEFRSLVERLPGVAGEVPLAPGELLRKEDEVGAVPAAIVPGRQLVGRVAGARGSAASGDGSGLQLTLDFDAIGTEAGEATAAGTVPLGGDGHALGPAVGQTGAAPATAVEVLPADPRGRLAALLAEPGRAERLGPDESLADWLARQPELAIGLAVDDPRPRRGTLLGMAVAGPDGRLVTADATRAEDLLRAVVAAGRPIVGHDAKRLLVAELARRDPDGRAPGTARDPALPRVSFDTQIAAYILNAALRSQSLADIAAERLGAELPKAGDLGGADHAALEAAAVAAAREALVPPLEEEGLERLYRELELPLIPVLARMEAAGVALDREALGGLATSFAEEIGRLEAEIYAAVGHEFNLGSPKQLEQVLFYELNLPRGKRTKTGYSTDASVLEELRPAHPMIPLLLDWRVYTKLKSTYVDALPLMLDPRTGRLHTTFHQAVASTGRLSSSDPNLQNIPIRS
ncbi:MAG TPA: DNA polymerase, partial [Candidatus Dormibacteraeota bacterium]|nr:DNA polymerase [Candidatus Dormibacteraeota bacterium]